MKGSKTKICASDKLRVGDSVLFGNVNNISLEASGGLGIVKCLYNQENSQCATLRNVILFKNIPTNLEEVVPALSLFISCECFYNEGDSKQVLQVDVEKILKKCDVLKVPDCNFIVSSNNHTNFTISCLRVDELKMHEITVAKSPRKQSIHVAISPLKARMQSPSALKYSPIKKPRLTDVPNSFKQVVVVNVKEDIHKNPDKVLRNRKKSVESVVRKLLMTPEKVAKPRSPVKKLEIKPSRQRVFSIESSSESDISDWEVAKNVNVMITRSATRSKQKEQTKNCFGAKETSKSLGRKARKEMITILDEETLASSEDDVSPKKRGKKNSPIKLKLTKKPSMVRLRSRSRSVCTPKIPERERGSPNIRSPLNKLRANLHVSAVPDTLPCREKEFSGIYSFVESKIRSGIGGCMYISGVPGTGKTATVNEVVRVLQDGVERGEFVKFKFVSINGMKLPDPHQAYVQIMQELTGEKVTKDHAAKLLEDRFSKPMSAREMVVMMIDELDLLWTRKQDVMYNLFDWPSRPKSRLVVLAIANTMDLPERMMNRVSSRLGLTRITFQPYSFTQLQEILESRIGNGRSFHADAVQLISRKVAAISGDARRALDISRRATEIAESNRRSPLKGGVFLVRIDDAKKAIEEMFSSPKIEAIRNASVHEKLFLRAVVGEMLRTGVEEAVFNRVFIEHITLCKMEGMDPPNNSTMSRIVARLCSCSLVLIENGKSEVNARVRLNVGVDDVNYALQT